MEYLELGTSPSQSHIGVERNRMKIFTTRPYKKDHLKVIKFEAIYYFTKYTTKMIIYHILNHILLY